MRMWEQYADEHAGVCLVFLRDRFETVMQRQLEGRGRPHVESVTYTAAGIAASEVRHLMDDGSTTASAPTKP